MPTVLLVATVSANDWPHWRGPSATGVAAPSPLPSTWNARDNVAWQAALAGAGVSSPIVHGSRVFVTSQIGDGRRRDGRHPTLTQGADPSTAGEATLSRRSRAQVGFIVEAFDRSTGKRLWIHEMAAEGELPPVHDKHNLSSASPVTDGERVYAWYGTGQLIALDMTGTPAWSKNLAKEYGAFDIQWGHSSSPALFQDTLILLCYHPGSSYLLALDKRTGAVKWKADKAPGIESYSSPIVAAGPNGPELIVNSSVGVEAFDPTTGKSLWTYPEVNRFPIPVSMVDNGVLFLSRGYRSSPFMAIRLGGRGDITKTHVVWRVPTGGPYVSSLVHYQGVIYMSTDNGIVSAVDASNGERLWQERVGGTFSASPIAGDGKVYFQNEEGVGYVVKASPEFKLLAENDLEERSLASYAVGAESTERTPGPQKAQNF